MSKENKYRISRSEMERMVNDYYTNPILCFAFGIDFFNREEIRDKEVIRSYVERFYSKEPKVNGEKNE